MGQLSCQKQERRRRPFKNDCQWYEQVKKSGDGTSECSTIGSGEPFLPTTAHECSTLLWLAKKGIMDIVSPSFQRTRKQKRKNSLNLSWAQGNQSKTTTYLSGYHRPQTIRTRVCTPTGGPGSPRGIKWPGTSHMIAKFAEIGDNYTASQIEKSLRLVRQKSGVTRIKIPSHPRTADPKTCTS